MPDRLIRAPEVEHLTGLSRRTIYRKIKVGQFPAVIRLGANSVAWRESEVAAWVAAPQEWGKAA